MTDYISRGVPLLDLDVKGRTVTAYAAVFDTPAEIRDSQGHYIEDISRSAFNKSAKEAGLKAGVFYNHGMTIHGTPSDLYSIPLGVPVSVTPDAKGLLTVSRYNNTATADAVLEAIRDGGVKGHSFTGRIIRSSPERMPRASRGGDLPKITRTELGLREYGPTPFPAYSQAEIQSVRSVALSGGGAVLSEDEKARLLYELLMRTTQLAAPVASITPSGADPVEPIAESDHSERNRQLIRDRISRSGVLAWKPTAKSSSATAPTDGPST
jgi:HK97 family phage prohead protease